MAEGRVLKVLEGKKDSFGGFIVDENKLPNDKNEFDEILGGEILYRTKLIFQQL